MSLGIALVVADDFVFVAKDFLLGLEQLQVGRGGLWDFMVVFNFELVRHSIIQIISLQLFYLSFANSHSPFLLDSHGPNILVVCIFNLSTWIIFSDIFTITHFQILVKMPKGALLPYFLSLSFNL